ncbi:MULTISPECIES: efflux RND transporter periplasmic adaptor subunit [Pontibacillus]|uniref:Efflux RND transporter periplasmic adaptor subunit n=1 Tax=Pontibacillus chungwhensis TaxID=265426 RepID=A0ABY8UXE9_9BACI|nr:MULTISPECIES: efflux RND transporter periplasmic adaptor subunit [Pontibacillus]MCD5324269.1 efflux RND transporter periplasmic adaptor subunit [Pontibacillus sp. HN14]WIF97677.1 efflux RND transporter periplasmic adaptor subunit [Pontibacillus chungwhensis]
MKKNRKRWIVVLTTTLLVVANIILVVLSEDEVERKSYISKWDTPFTADLENAIAAEGVFQPSTEEYVYFDKDLGSFQQFVVEEGDEVQLGDPLFEYVVRDYWGTVNQLEGQISGLEEEVDALEDYVDDVEDIDVPEPEEDDDRPFAEAEVNQEQSEAEAEKELALKEAQLEALEDQLDQVEDRGQVVEVSSLFDGTIKELDHNLEDPAVTIARSDRLIVTGNVDEQNRVDVEEGMKARGTVEKLEESWEGQVGSADDFPIEGSSELGDSAYPFVVELNEDIDRALPGYHSTVYLTVEEVQNVLTVYQNWIHLPINGMEDFVSDRVVEEEALEEESEEVQEEGPDEEVESPEDAKAYVEGPYAWVMNDLGVVEKRPLELGMDEYNLQQVQKGLTIEDWVADEPDEEFREGTTFLTSLQAKRIDLTDVRTLDRGVMWEYAKMGLLMR